MKNHSRFNGPFQAPGTLSCKQVNSALVNDAARIIFGAVLLSFAINAHALPDQDQAATDQPVAQKIKATTPGMHLVLNAGITYGGDTIATAVYTSGETQNIKAGSLMQIGIGGLWQSDKNPVALMLSANYHFDARNASNGEISFERFPIEVLAYYTGKERLRIGGGMRFVNSPEASTTINGVTEKMTFENAIGIVGEIGYGIIEHCWLNFRYVSEEYQGKDFTSGGTTTSLAGTAPYKGSHLGVNFSYEF